MVEACPILYDEGSDAGSVVHCRGCAERSSDDDAGRAIYPDTFQTDHICGLSQVRTELSGVGYRY